ncbi:hypothetical protein Ancab_022326 [Ancistrocladus abbreviatus]
MLIRDLLLSPLLQVLFDRIASLLDFFLRGGLDKSRLKDLKNILSMLERVHDNAEEKQFTDGSVREWLHDLKAAVFDAEDLLDQIAAKSLPSQSWCAAVSNCVPSPLNSFERAAASRLDDITQMLESLASQIPILGLTAGAPLSTASQTRLTTSLVKGSQVYGRKEEKDRIIQSLLPRENEEGGAMGGVAIVGMGGMGKTTLARSIYNDDDRLKGRFDLKLWIYVSNDFDVVGVTRSALESITSKPCKLHSLETIQVELREKLRGKKFLVVLDDVWSERIEDWELLCCPFNNGAQGSRIIVTTRNEGVADIMGGFPKVRLHKLSKEDGWSLLSRYAFQSGSITGADSQLVKIGQEIVEKCDGLPLAIKILGSLLLSKLERKHWEKVRDRNIWDLREGNNDILPALSLSYCFLPSRLKRCFAYCAMFPKGYRFEKEMLIRLWMAGGFLDSIDDNIVIEEVGDECFMELLSRSFFDEVGGSYVIHDLVHDLAKFVSGDFCACLEQNKPWKIDERARHISYHWDYCDNFDRFEALSKARNVRSFLSLRSPYGQDADRVTCEMLPKLDALRVLSFSFCNIIELPTAIGDLKQLRYLDVSSTGIKELPESICTLCNLQTLLLEECQGLQELPNAIGDLKQLRHLDVSSTGIKELPESICTLCKLQTLSLQGCQGLQELPNAIGKLKQLQGLDVSSTGIKELPESICTLCNLPTLFLKECRGLQELPNAIGDLKQLRHLDVSSTGIKELPESICTLCNLQTLSLQGCQGLQELPTAISDLKQLRYLDVSSTGIKELPESICTLCNLQTLFLEECQGLQELPNAIGDLKQLRHLDVSSTGIKELPESICTLCNLQTLWLREWLQELPNAIGDLKQLQDLNVSFTGIKELPESICTLCNLQTLSLRGCQGLQKLPNAIGDLKQLRHLDVSSTVIKELLESICTLCNLQTLSLQGCQGLQKLPTAISDLKQLRYLDVSSTGIKELPESICTLCNLQTLLLEECRGLQELPNAIGDLKQLRHLDVSSTGIKELPESICTLCKLQTLSLQGCQGLQELPNAIGKLKQLQGLDVSSTGIKELPESICTLCNLPTLFLTKCRGLQELPNAIGDLKQLRYLDVSSTGIKELPESICTLFNLQKLFLKKCRGLQELPNAIGDLKQLRHLDASSTGIKELPESICTLCNLRTLSLQGCQGLQELPNAIGKLKQLWDFDVSSTGIKELPESICTLCNLQTLSLQGCQGLQELPNAIGNLKRLRFLDSYLNQFGLCATCQHSRYKDVRDFRSYPMQLGIGSSSKWSKISPIFSPSTLQVPEMAAMRISSPRKMQLNL